MSSQEGEIGTQEAVVLGRPMQEGSWELWSPLYGQGEMPPRGGMDLVRDTQTS